MGSTLTLNIQWVTTPDHGYPWEIQLFDDTTNTSGTPKPTKTYDISGQGLTNSMTVPYKVNSDGYIRLKPITILPAPGPIEKVAYTNPIFISTKGASLDKKYPSPIGGEILTFDPFDFLRIFSF